MVSFTEYKDTLEYLEEKLGSVYGEDHLLTLYGGMNSKDCEVIKDDFQADLAETRLRILMRQMPPAKA